MQMLKINTGTAQCKNLAFKTQHNAMREEISMAPTENKRTRGCYCAVTQQDSLCIFTVIGVLINTRTPKEWTGE